MEKGNPTDAGARVLVVDDYALTREMVKAILRQTGAYEVSSAEDGSVALELLRAEKFALVICDWNMPNVSGITVLREVRKSSELNKDVPFLMLTAEGFRENVVEAMHAGVSDYIVKPFTAQVLADKIQAVIRGKK